MATQENNTNDGTNEPKFDRTPVKFGKVKATYHSPDEFFVNVNRNIRTTKGVTAYGVTASGDSYDLTGIETAILERDGIIQTPLVVFKNDEGKLEVLQGNRRAWGSQNLYHREDTPKEVKKNLEKIPAYVLTDLTDAQKAELVFDQDTKSFLDSEVVRDVFNLRGLGWNFDQIVMSRTEALLKIMKNGKELGAEIRSINDPAARRKKITTGMHGTIGNGLLDAYGLGDWMRKTTLQSYMLRDGLIEEGKAEMPYFKVTSNMQERVRKLRQARKDDGTKFNPLMLVEGTKFKEMADLFHKEDYNPDPKDKGKTKKMLGKEGVKTLKSALQSKLAQAILSRIEGETVPELQMLDTETVILQTKSELAEKYIPLVRPEVAKMLRQYFLNPDVNDFVEYLTNNLLEEVETEAEANADAHAEDEVQAEITA